MAEFLMIGTGRVAVIAPPGRVAETAAALGLIPGPDLEAPVAVLTSEQAKGFEFDSVIIVDPAAIEQASRAAGPTCTLPSPGPPAGSGLSRYRP